MQKQSVAKVTEADTEEYRDMQFRLRVPKKDFRAIKVMAANRDSSRHALIQRWVLEGLKRDLQSVST